MERFFGASYIAPPFAVCLQSATFVSLSMNRFEPYSPAALAVPNLLQTTEIFEVKDLKDKLQKDADQMVKASDNFQQVSHYSMHVKSSSSGYLFSMGFPVI
jgi:hypothetical protein